MNGNELKKIRITTLIIMFGAFIMGIFQIGNMKLIGVVLIISFFGLLFIPDKHKGENQENEMPGKEISGKIIGTDCVRLVECVHSGSLYTGFSSREANIWYNYIVVEEESGELVNILTSKVSNTLAPEKYINYDDLQYEVGDRVKLSIKKHDDILWRKENMFG